MTFEEFKTKILAMLKDFYGHDACVGTVSNWINPETCYVGLTIRFVDEWSQPISIICINDYYENYRKGNLSIVECVGAIIDFREKQKTT